MLGFELLGLPLGLELVGLEEGLLLGFELVG
jgi:hypothetical protein